MRFLCLLRDYGFEILASERIYLIRNKISLSCSGSATCYNVNFRNEVPKTDIEEKEIFISALK